ncbi:MAG: YggS family pyridoxal phosphate-dependent enzyme [Propionibacteriaceae bacterium]|jgi:pyridoxal phosphate enzyme (YggS family)|nr:YggS family pyridoxal phosphate-dependent enzyme [Propionibacteriaceae bacterium]
MALIAENLLRCQQLITQACHRAERDDHEVRLLPISKNIPVDHIRQAIDAGCHTFGENRIQEMMAKSQSLPFVAWEMVGHLQRNKVKDACWTMSLLHSLDSLPLARKLEDVASQLIMRGPIRVLVEVNTSKESSKTGIPVDQVLQFTQELAHFPHLAPSGLMTVAHPDRLKAEEGFAALAQLRRELQDRDGGGWTELSMGMTSDFDLAIKHGSTCVRLGTAIFGPRFTG